MAQGAEAAVICASFGDVAFGEDVGVQCVDDGVGLCKGYACAVDEVYGLEGGVGFYDVLPGATAVAKRAAAGRNRLALSFPDLKKRFYELNYPEKSCK